MREEVKRKLVREAIEVAKRAEHGWAALIRRDAKRPKVLALIHTARQEWERGTNREAFDQLLATLEAGYRTTWAESRALARLFREATRERTKKDRGRKPAKHGTEAYYYRRAMQEVRDRAKEAGLTHGQALKLLVHLEWPSRAKILRQPELDWSRFENRIKDELHIVDRITDDGPRTK